MSEATEVVAEEVAEQATHVAAVSRGLSGRSLGLALGGFVVGAGLGATAGYILASRRLEAKYRQIADDEIEEMREHYYRKDVAREKKDDLEDIIRDKGYSSPEPSEPPMAVTPPSAVVEAAKEDEDEPVETEAVREEPEVRNAFEEFGDQTRSPDDWDYHKERSRRSPLRPYVIHIDEVEEKDTYDKVTFTYFADDDVLCDETDDPVSKEDRERMVGEANLDKFGHGSPEPDVVYIRNDKLDTVFVVNRSPNSFAEEVHGFEPEIRHADRRRGRLAFDDE